MQKTNRYQWGLVLLAAAVVIPATQVADAPSAPVPPAESSRTEVVIEVKEPAQDPQPSPEPPSNADPVTGVEPDGPTIVMVSLEGCGPCDRWWGQRRKWEDVGWNVQKTYGADGVRLFPTFRIYHKDEWHQHEGYMSYSDAADLLGLDMPRRSVQQASASLAHGQYDGTSRWTYPGDISGHMMGPNHGYSRSQLVGKSKDELEAMHSSAHEQSRGSVIYQRPVRSGSSCPGGTCPTQPTRRGLFGWRR